MIDELFNRIRQHNLTDWGVILLGVTGVPGVAGRLSSSLIEGFAAEELKGISLDDPLLEIVAGLAMDSPDLASELRESLEKICRIKKIDLDVSRRKWRFVSLESTLSNLDMNPVYGLLALSEFWSNLGWPVDAPASMRDGGGKMSSQEYHSKLNFQRVLKEHQEWLARELVSLH